MDVERVRPVGKFGQRVRLRQILLGGRSVGSSVDCGPGQRRPTGRRGMHRVRDRWQSRSVLPLSVSPTGPQADGE